MHHYLPDWLFVFVERIADDDGKRQSANHYNHWENILFC